MADLQHYKDAATEQLATYLIEKGGVLFLGPGMALYQDTDIPILNKFAEDVPNSYSMDPSDEKDEKSVNFILQRVMNKNGASEHILSSLRKDYKDFFEANFIKKELYKKIANLNFNLIINTNPDKEILNFINGEKKFAFYDCFSSGVSNGKELDSFSFDSGAKLLYNIFGSFDVINSVLLTETDFIELIRKVHGENNNIPNCIKNHIRSEIPLVFIGFDFNEWQFKVLLKVLELDKKSSMNMPDLIKKPVSVHANQFPIPRVALTSFYEGEFKIDFRTFDFDRYIFTLQHFSPGKENIDPPKKFNPLITTLLYNTTSEDDKELKNKLSIQLKALRNKYIDEPWSVELAMGGLNMEDRLSQRISTTQLLIPLLSGDFFADELLVNCIKELKDRKDVMILPVLLRYHKLENYDCLQGLKIFPYEDGKTVPLSKDNNKNELDRLGALICDQIEEQIKLKG